MSGIYVHIPFCKQACHYCNFHFSTSLKYRKEMVDALCLEISLRYHYLTDTTVSSIYLGGGTPSILNDEELTQIFTTIEKYFKIEAGAEITLEANPDDLTAGRLQTMAQSPVNRLSIGVQSFFAEDLEFMNRAHNATEAAHCIELAQAEGFDNLSADLIYGAPTTSDENWRENIDTMTNFQIPHLSCYCLTVEPNTALDHFVKKGIAPPVDEVKAARQFEYLMDKMQERGYDHYEISNFAKPGHYARHNTNYWKGVPYLGIGPGAHSFNGVSRQWNIAHNAKYIKGINENELPFEKEMLSLADQYNEYVMTGLRTNWGVEVEKLRALGEVFLVHFERQMQVAIDRGEATIVDDHYILTKAGRLLADGIAAEAFWVDKSL